MLLCYQESVHWWMITPPIYCVMIIRTLLLFPFANPLLLWPHQHNHVHPILLLLSPLHSLHLHHTTRHPWFRAYLRPQNVWFGPKPRKVQPFQVIKFPNWRVNFFWRERIIKVNYCIWIVYLNHPLHRFYWHDVVSGRNPSSIEVVSSGLKNSTTSFGAVNMIENPLTLEPQLNSQLVGMAQGFYASTSQSEVTLLMAMNFAITEGKYNGSSFTILGRNPVFNKKREMPVIGGSGLFRFARGYAQLRTHWFSPATRDAIVEYTVYLLHYWYTWYII